MPLELTSLLAFIIYTVVLTLSRGQPRAVIIAGLAMLLIGATVFAIGKESIANLLAMYSLYFLLSGVVWLLIEGIRPGH